MCTSFHCMSVWFGGGEFLNLNFYTVTATNLRRRTRLTASTSHHHHNTGITALALPSYHHHNHASFTLSRKLHRRSSRMGEHFSFPLILQFAVSTSPFPSLECSCPIFSSIHINQQYNTDHQTSIFPHSLYLRNSNPPPPSSLQPAPS